MNARTTPGHVATVVIALTVLAGACGAKADTASDESKPVPHAPVALSDSEPGAGIARTASQPPASMNTSATGSSSRQSREAAHTHGAAGRSGRTSPNGPGGPADAAPVSSDSIALEDCRERFVIAPGVEEEVRPRVPSRFELRRNSSGQPLLFVSAIRCERYTVNGDRRETTAAAFMAPIESPDGVACASDWPAVGMVKPDAIGSCSNYIFFVAYDNPAVVEWARQGIPDLPTHQVENLDFAEGPFDPASLGAPFHYAAPSAPSPYEMDLVVRERPVPTGLTGSFWFEGSDGTTVRFRFTSDDYAFGEATGTLNVGPGSEMAEMFGTTTPEPQAPFPFMAGNHWHQGELTKTLFAPGEM